MSEPNPKLLSLLDQIVNPVEKVTVTLDVHGVFAFPEEWKATDEANPNLFTYQVKMFGLDVTNGKVIPRQLTEKELREQEELAAQKNKKAAKKDAKQEVQLTPEEEEEQRKIREREEEEERRRLEEWNTLDEQTRFYRTHEDKYKSPSIKFESAHGSGEDASGVASVSQVKEGTGLVVFEERVQDDKGDWIYFVKQPTLPEDELAKLRKSKPKNLNLSDLNPVVMRAWVNLDKFGVPGTSEITQRCKVEQHNEEGAPADTPHPNLEHTYILITVRLDTPITPLVTEIQPKLSDLVPQPPPIPKLSAASECLQEFRSELQLAMESLAIEYSQMFAKELGQSSDPKQKATITVQKKQEIQKRKEHFLYDFNISGKYKVLKERLKKSIVRICRDKFQKQGSITGITTDQKDQFYSELYVFLMEQTRQTLSDLINQKKEELHEDIVTSYDQTQKERDRILQNITEEKEHQRLLRLAKEYEMINLTDLAEKNFKNLINKDDREPKNYYEYTKFLLKSKNFAKAEQMLEKALSFDDQNTDYQLLMTLLLLRRGRAKEASVFLKELLGKDQTNQLYNITLSFLYKKFLGEDRLGEKYKRIAERIYQRKRNNLQSKGQHKQAPNPFELPSLKPISAAEAEANRPPQLEKSEWDEIYLEMIELFARYNIYDLVEKAYELMHDQTTYKAQRIQCLLLQFKESYQQCLQVLDRLYDSVKEDKTKKRELEEIITIKANICYQIGQLYESEDIFLKAMKLKGSKKQDLSIFLRLGNIYLKRKSWGDAKAIFVKACEFKRNSSLSWLGLGIACLRIEEYREAEEALTQANIYDPFNGDVWGYLALLCLKDKGRFTQANQCLRELFKTDCSDAELLEELGDALSDLNQNETAETIYIKVIELGGKSKIVPPNYGELNLKLGRTYLNLKKYNEAVVCFEEALMHLESETDRTNALTLKKQATQYADQSSSDND